MTTPLRRISPDPEGQNQVRVVAALRYGYRTVAVITVLVAVGAVLIASLLPKKYASTLTAQILTRAGVSAPGVLNDSSPEDPTRQLETQAEIVLSDAVIDPIAQDMEMNPDDIRAKITVTTSLTADTLDITAKGTSPKGAQSLAEAVGDAWVAQVTASEKAQITDAMKALAGPLQQAREDAGSTTTSPEAQVGAQERLSSLEQTQATLESQLSVFVSPVKVLSAAYLPTGPSNVGHAKAGVLGILVGALVGSGFVLVRTTRLRPLRAVAEIEKAVGHPVIAVAPHVEDLRLNPGHVGDVLGSPNLLDTARALAGAAEAATRGSGGSSVLLVTGSGRFAGRSATAVQLAVGLARSAHSVVLVDADTRWVPENPGHILGLTDALRAALSPGGAMSAVAQASAVLTGLLPDSAGVAHVTAGTGLTEGPDLLRTRALASVLSALRSSFDFVILDGPALEAPESRALMRAADGTFLAVSTEDLAHDALVQGVSLLAGTEVLGVVVVDSGNVFGGSASQIVDHYGTHPDGWRPTLLGRRPAAAPKATTGVNLMSTPPSS